jgi:hypothetical protein
MNAGLELGPKFGPDFGFNPARFKAVLDVGFDVQLIVAFDVGLGIR